MINKKAIELLEKNSCILRTIYEEKELPMPDDLEKLRFNNIQALALLKEQPPASEFTKEMRLTYELRPKVIEGKIAAKHIFDLCDSLDVSEASCKELKELLTEYGRHSPGCSREFGKKYRCRCGWSEVIANK